MANNINLYDAYNQKRRKFGLNDSARFRSSFVDAVNFSFSELNNLVFQAETLGSIGSFDDVIDERLASFTSLTFDAGANTAIESREFWAMEWDFERLSNTNGFIDTITMHDASEVVLSISSGVFSVAGAAVAATATIPDLDTFTLRFESTSEGTALLVNGDTVALTYTVGDGDTTQAIGAIETNGSHIISDMSGYNLLRTRFLSAATAIYDFNLNLDSLKTATTDTLVDLINNLELVGLPGTLLWKTVYIEPSSGLSTRYKAVLDMGLDYHLQDGGEWALEIEPERERKWYGRGIKDARNIFQQTTTYTSPLGI
jgi:hypothetical protein